jgi:Na+-driven multidrug efflux pump
MFSLTLSTLAARWGAEGVAAQSIGSQIEAISWMTAAGFSTALASFTGQNYGAKQYDRIRKGYRLTLQIAGSFGLLASLLFFLFDKEIFSLFVKEPKAIEVGGDYLRILAFSQLFMVTESVTAGAFYGTGHTIAPSLTGIIFNAIRIPFAFWLVTFPFLGLNGIWWSITITSIVKGTLLPLWYLYFQHQKMPKNQ